MILRLKCLYQTVQIRFALAFYRFFGRKKDPFELAVKKLSARNYKWKPGAPVKVFAVFAITNWEEILLDPLCEIGETYHFGWPDGQEFFSTKSEWKEFQDGTNSSLLTAFDRFYDAEANMIVFMYSSDFVISESTMQTLKKGNTLIINFCWDDLLYFKGYLKGQQIGIATLSKYADVNLTLSPEAIVRYHYNDSPCFFWKSLPIPINTPELCSVEDEEFYVLFIGSKYGWREQFVNTLRNACISVRCYGNGWENRPLPEDEMWTMIQRAPVTLGFANVGYTKSITTIKGRDFEVPLHGGLFLTQYSKGLSIYYQPGRDVYTYMDVNDCIRQIAAIRDNRDAAFKVRQSGYQQALRMATWKSRFMYLDSVINKITMSV